MTGKEAPHLNAYWLSSEKMTVMIKADDSGKIYSAAPIVRKFIGQHMSRLEDWMKRQGSFRKVKLHL
jgi:hypothetical protein